MAIDPGKLARLRALIALAGSPELEEARTAAYKACQIMREEKIDATEVVALLGPSPQTRAPSPPPPPPAQPAWSPPRLSSEEVELEVERAVQQALRLRATEVNALRLHLWEAEEELRRRDAEDAARRHREQKQRELDYLRARRAAPIPPSNGAGKKSWW